MLLLSTDGLTDLVSDREIGAIVRENPTPQQACDALVARALDYGGKDNITVVIARYTSRPRVAPAATTV
jgi:protein phosphatase